MEPANLISFSQSENSLSNLKPNIEWDKFNLCTMCGEDKYLFLKDTRLGFNANFETSNVKSLENRQKFMETVVSDLVQNCKRKDLPLVFISLGPNLLLTEYILGKTFIENGFKDILFFLVDPVYKAKNFSKYIDGIRKDFRTKLTELDNKYEKNGITWLSRSQNIKNYELPCNANVVIIESFPPYTQAVQELKKHQNETKAPNEILSGNCVVDSNIANAVAFVPKTFITTTHGEGEEFALKMGETEDGTICFDWGCKILSDGSYHLSFSGLNELFCDKKVSQEFKDEIKKMVSLEIKKINKPLSQNNTTNILNKIVECVKNSFPKGNIHHFYLADYTIDRNEMLAHVTSKVGGDYRKSFIITADHNCECKINIEKY